MRLSLPLLCLLAANPLRAEPVAVVQAEIRAAVASAADA